MQNYIFRMPAGTPPLTYPMLRGLAERARGIGCTVTLQHYSDCPPYVQFDLYRTTLARIYPDHVEFAEHGDQHKATTAWLTKIVQDNGIGSQCYHERFVLYAYGSNSGKPLEGATFPAAPSCGHCGALIEHTGPRGEWKARSPFYEHCTFSSWIPDGRGSIRQATDDEMLLCKQAPGGRHEPWCNHDAAAVRNGVCECGAKVSR